MSQRPIATTLLIALLAISTHAQENPLARNSKFVGTYSGDGVTMTLSSVNGKYEGKIKIDNQEYPCTGEASGYKLTGQLTAEGKAFEFTAVLSKGDLLDLTSGGQTYHLTKSTEPTNPLAKPKSEPAAPANPLAKPKEQPPQAPLAPAPENLAPGGVGIMFEQMQDGTLILKGIMPGGPADKAGIKTQGKLVAIDGKAIEGLSLEQVRTQIRGPVGSQVTLTIETEKEVMDVILNRVAIPSAPPAEPLNIPNSPNPTPLPGKEPLPGLQQGAFPAWMKPGVKITFWQGSATVPGVTTVLSQDDKGNWVDANGNRFAEGSNPGSGGYGYTVLNIVGMTENQIAVDARSYTVVDPQNGVPVTTTAVGYVGTPEQLGDYWINPAKLAREQELNQGGVRIRRLEYPLNNKIYKAISFETRNAQGYQRSTYDLETGLLISGGGSTSVNAGFTPNPNGTSTPSSNTSITQTFFNEVKETNLPWANDALPQWLAPGATITYAGSYISRIPNVPEMPWKYSASFTLDKAIGTSFVCKQHSILDMGMGGQPQVTNTDRCLGVNMVGSFYISPQTLQSMQPNQVIDQSPITKRRVVYAGIQNGLASIYDQGPLDTQQFLYDTRSGNLVGINSEMKQGIATISINLQAIAGN